VVVAVEIEAFVVVLCFAAVAGSLSLLSCPTLSFFISSAITVLVLPKAIKASPKATHKRLEKQPYLKAKNRTIDNSKPFRLQSTETIVSTTG
jgi:hypothetical protein